jgi:hypothetical protein
MAEHDRAVQHCDDAHFDISAKFGPRVALADGFSAAPG